LYSFCGTKSEPCTVTDLLMIQITEFWCKLVCESLYLQTLMTADIFW